MANFPNSSLEEVVHESFQLVDKDRLLVLFNQEVSEDVARVREYKAKACGLKVAMRRREEYIGELKALGDCEDVVETVEVVLVPIQLSLKFIESSHSSTVNELLKSVVVGSALVNKYRYSDLIVKVSHDIFLSIFDYLCDLLHLL
ncbi:hypothetical protein Tco_0019700 [Tanacetum coccineum]